MALVWKHPKSKFWFARYTAADGRRVNKSTKETNRQQALQIALGWEHAERLARRSELTTERARAVVSEILERVTDGKESIRAVPTAKFFNDWLEAKRAVKSDKTATRYKGTIKLFLEHLGERRNRPLISVRPIDVQEFLTARAQNRSSKTVVVDAKSLSAAFTYATRHGLIDRNPVHACELPKAESQARGVFTPQQVGLLVAAASADWKTCILFGFYTGARLSDVVNLQWADVDLAEGLVTYRQQKTGTETVTPLHPELLAHLERIAGDVDGPLMPKLAGRDPGGKTGLSAHFNAIMAQAGIAQHRIKLKSGKSFAELTFHSLRHSFESALANAGVSAELRRELGGRADAATQRGYTHLELETMRKALKKLPKVGI